MAATAKKNGKSNKAKEISEKLKKTMEKNQKGSSGGKVLDLKAKLKNAAKNKGKKGKSCITNEKERQKLERYGIEVIEVHDPDLGESAAEIRVDNDLAIFTLSDRHEAVVIAKGLYEHIKAQAEKLTKQALKDLEGGE